MADKPPCGVVVLEDMTLGVEEAQEALAAIRKGQVDALVISRAGQRQEVVLLQGADRAYQVLLETLNEGALAVTAGGLVVYANLRFAELVGRPVAEVVGADVVRFVAPDDAAALASLLAAARRGSSKGELRLARPGGGVVPVMISVRAVEEEAAESTFTVVATDLSAIQEAQAALQAANDRLSASERQLRASLREKDVLLREAHHRVKNNLQVISSMLHLQSRYVADEAARDALRESRGRVRTIALVHEELYRSSDMGSIDLGAYLQSLVRGIVAAYDASVRGIAVEVPSASARVGVDTAMHCGLVVHELVTNAFKHAFPGGRRGRITIALRREGDDHVLSVTDDGVGFPDGLDVRATQTLGLQLVRSLAEQLGGSVTMTRGAGTAVAVRFPTPPP
jgi:PAS domain S-box-containing protein